MQPIDLAVWHAGPYDRENRSDKLARLLEIGTGPPEDTAVYVGLDLMYRARNGTEITIRSRAGRPYAPGAEVPAYEDADVSDR